MVGLSYPVRLVLWYAKCSCEVAVFDDYLEIDQEIMLRDDTQGGVQTSITIFGGWSLHVLCLFLGGRKTVAGLALF